ncbi:MAG: hypothetical protein KBT34_08385, partial [Prevotella sp.]|nr:hypothetical protein [Candidatus Prevotella equi]
NNDEYADEPIEISVNASWQCGRGIATTRALTDPVGKVDVSGHSKQFPDALYPDWLHITLTDGTAQVSSFSPLPDKYLVKKTISENDNYVTQQYIAYHAVYSLANYNDESKREKKPFYTKSQIQKLNVEANTLSSRFIDGKIPQAWDNQDIATFGTIDHLTTGGAAYNVFDPLFHGRYHINRNHLFLDLGHVTALLRLHFKVDERYDKIRKIVLRKVKITKVGDTTLSPAYEFTLNASQTIDTSLPEAERPGFLLTPVSKFYAYGYMKPSHSYDGYTALSSVDGLSWGASATPISANIKLTLECTYDIYENDIITNITNGTLNTDLSAHCTRRSVTATNAFTFGTTTASTGNTITKIKAGHYYDLLITINPDYLYVLAEHDDKHHITIQ